MSTYNILRPGLSNAASYQSSGVPFVSGGLSVPDSGSAPIQISFPAVTKKIIIQNVGAHDLKMGFSQNGVTGTNYLTVVKKGDPQDKLELEVKCTSVFLISAGSATTAEVAAELTNIPVGELPTNWSGSLGVG